MTGETTILVVDDQIEILDNIGLALEAEGYRVLTALDGRQALTLLDDHEVQAILADIAMPHLNGYQLLERVRANPRWVHIPFLFLTARVLDSDVRYGKELGVDDYLTKPIEPEDLIAAVRGKLRRSRQLQQALDPATSPARPATAEPGHPASPNQPPPSLVFGPLQIDSGQFRVWMNGETVKLSTREFILLDYLAQRAGRVISGPELIKATHDYETDSIEAGSLLRPLIRTLRRKLGYGPGNMGCIENVRGVGYRLNPPA